MASSRNYPLLLSSQFLGAFGDNAILAVILGQLTYLAKAGTISDGELRVTSEIYTSLLFVPFVGLAPLAGYLNDRFAKTTWLSGGNALKLAGTLICAAGVGTGYVWQGVGYFIVGIGACVYGPAKYGILPEILRREQLVKANGMVELLTLIAILTGAIGGAILADVFKDRVLVSFGILAIVYGVSLGLNLLMTRTPSNPGIRLVHSAHAFFGHLGDLLRSPRLSRILLGTVLFWICGATMKINFQPWGLDVLQLPNNTQIALLGLWLSVGVMIGSILAGRWYATSELRGTRRYGFGLAVLLALLASVEFSALWQTPTLDLGPVRFIVPVVGLLLGAGVTAGLFLIPLNAALQAESDPQKLGKTIAGQNFCENLGMIAAGLVCGLAPTVGISASGVFLVLAVLVVAAVAALRIPVPSRESV